MLRAAKLEAELYEEVEADQKATGQATGVVILSGLAAGLGAGAQGGVPGVVLGTVVALLGWYLWAFLTYWVGTRILPEPQTEADLGELLRTTGFSSAPGLLRILGVVPALRGVVFVGSSIWMLVAMIIAVRQALDYRSTLRAVGVCAIGWLVQILLLAFLVGIFGSPERPM
ncbi:MAG: YIP1 family protein [Candidatus Tectomicrobia bacterium]|nr:YIP1 family protein [Candidatus Tectomicrobia bacterium]